MIEVRQSIRILSVEDDRITQQIVSHLLVDQHYHVSIAESAESALELVANEYFDLILIDRMLPGMHGLELCKKLRAIERVVPFFLIMCTDERRPEEIVHGFESGADDYVTKPFSPEELLACIKVGEKMIALQRRLVDKVAELESALAKVKTLEGIIPICSFGKKIRDDQNYWDSVEQYVTDHSNALFSHSICPDCMKKEYAEYMD